MWNKNEAGLGLGDGGDSNKQVGMMACKMTCNTYGMLWPRPTGQVELSQDLIHLLPGDISIAAVHATDANKELPDKLQTMIAQLRDIFKDYLYMMHPKYDKRSAGKNPFPSSKVFFLSSYIYLSR